MDEETACDDNTENVIYLPDAVAGVFGRDDENPKSFSRRAGWSWKGVVTVVFLVVGVAGAIAVGVAFPPSGENSSNRNIEGSSSTQPTTNGPSDRPSQNPTFTPTDIPSDLPSDIPSGLPSDIPSDLPPDTSSDLPSIIPSDRPSQSPPSSNPTNTFHEVAASFPFIICFGGYWVWLISKER